MRTLPIPLILFLLLGRLMLALLMSALRSLFRLPTRRPAQTKGRAAGASGMMHRGRGLRPVTAQVQDVPYRDIPPRR